MGYIINFDNSNNIRAAFLNDATPPTPPTPDFELTDLEVQLRDNAISRLNAVNPNHKYMAFGFITDLHESYDGIGYGTGTNPPLVTSKPSLKVLSAIAESYGLDGVFFGGDYSLGGDLSYAQYDAALEELLSTVSSFITVPHFAVEGNHDRWYDKNTNCRGNTVWKRFLTRFNTPNMAVFPTKNDATNGYVANSYYIDFPKYKVRVVMRSQYETQEKNGVPCSNSAGNGLGHFVNNLDDCMTFSTPSTAGQWTVLCVSHRALAPQNHWSGNSSLNKFFNGTLNGGTKGRAIVGEIYGHVHSTSSSKNEMNSDGTLLRVAQTNSFTTDLASPTNTSDKTEYVNDDYRFSLYVIDTTSFELHEIKVGIQYNRTDNQYYDSSTGVFSYPFKHNAVEPSGGTFKFYHISDPHAEVASLNECESLMNADESVAFTILTGDYVKGGVYGYTFSTKEFNSSSNKAISDKLKSLGSSFGHRFLLINGNHDAWDAFGGNNASSTSSYYGADYLQTVMGSSVTWDTADAHKLKLSGNPNIPPAYWYTDYQIPNKPNSKLRIIGIDQYEYRNNHGLSHWNTMFTQNQVDWIISTISELNPQDYFIIAQHTPPVNENRESCTGSRRMNSFCSANVSVWSASTTNGSLLPLIVDAYKNCKKVDEVVYNSNYANYTTQSTPSSVRVSVDFSAGTPSSRATFLCHLCGHVHGDIHRSHPEYQDQLILCIDQSNYGSVSNNPSDIKTSSYGVLINEVSIDFNASPETITVTRIGNGSGQNGYPKAGAYNGYGSIARQWITFDVNGNVIEESDS